MLCLCNPCLRCSPCRVCPGPRGATGPTGPTGPTGATGPIAQLSGMQVQLVSGAATVIANNDNVVFDNILNDQSLNISYDTTTGVFNLMRPGNYYIDWWVDVDGTEISPEVGFSIFVNGVSYSISSLPLVTGQISGSTLVTIGSTPATISLVNVTGGAVNFADTPVRANITIIQLTG